MRQFVDGMILQQSFHVKLMRLHCVIVYDTSRVLLYCPSSKRLTAAGRKGIDNVYNCASAVGVGAVGVGVDGCVSLGAGVGEGAGSSSKENKKRKKTRSKRK